MDKNEKNEELLHDITAFLENAGCDAASVSGTDAEGLPFESIDDFELDPIGFEDQQAVLMERAEDLFVLCQRYSRHSKKYLEACTYLDQSSRSLGSGCITRIAIIRNGCELPKLHNLSTTKLFEMASFNYRKINAALGEDMQNKHEFSMPLMGMLLRTYQTLERLRSTELRINKINIGDIPTTNEWKRSRTFVEHGINWFYDPSQNEAPAFRQAISYPIDYDQLDPESGFRMQDSDQFGMQNSELDSGNTIVQMGVVGDGSWRHRMVSEGTVPKDTAGNQLPADSNQQAENQLSADSSQQAEEGS